MGRVLIRDTGRRDALVDSTAKETLALGDEFRARVDTPKRGLRTAFTIYFLNCEFTKAASA
ncbi:MULTISPECIES: hypothetical protein [Methylosinus]|uniref:Uncharacterized protein n=1 Tax=Methylosinus trichosporium (strain ATCC 35070 / NCIMB 11131 / UNIQEM 75 / OB3b) TaxID=595536 RepID=A0A2D2D3R5_METT3|nr:MULTISPECIES: hypothetical protein [Methylosinus]ATQ69641.1 hypothetical protein CQW49_18455 [Methylosinus trichosporium OB3b]OBS53021.1 hypothetical protein A8B73_08030 [Methylosinus sp. 3S-1]